MKSCLGIGSCCHSNTRGGRNEMVRGNCRCCEKIYLGIWGGHSKLSFTSVPSSAEIKQEDMEFSLLSLFLSKLEYDSFFIILAGCKEQEHWEYSDLIWWSPLPHGLYGLCSGISFTSVLRGMLLSYFHAFQTLLTYLQCTNRITSTEKLI